MARIAYDDPQAAAFAATRELPDDGLVAWRAAVRPHVDGCRRLLDLGAGTGAWARAFTDWYGLDVLAVEPSAAMRARCRHRDLVAGTATSLPLRPSSVDGAWLSTVVHHLPAGDLLVAARELRRVVRPGGPVLIRSAFPGGAGDISLFRWFPEAGRALATYPSIERVATAFTAASFALTAHERVPQRSAPSVRAVAATLRREAHTPLLLITDDEYAAGLARLAGAAAAESSPTPVIDTLDLLVLR
jgi:SAM-dependent methyltransferase